MQSASGQVGWRRHTRYPWAVLCVRLRKCFKGYVKICPMRPGQREHDRISNTKKYIWLARFKVHLARKLTWKTFAQIRKYHRVSVTSQYLGVTSLSSLHLFRLSGAPCPQAQLLPELLQPRGRCRPAWLGLVDCWQQVPWPRLLALGSLSRTQPVRRARSGDWHPSRCARCPRAAFGGC